ncbi:YkgJ family cysteine cluster protein [Nitrospira sp. M1]
MSTSAVPQIVPSKACLNCKVCCRFPEPESFLRPFFTKLEIRQAVKGGVDSTFFPNREGCQVDVVPHPSGDGYLCPAFDPETSHCRIYNVRPLDCQIYPFVLMWDQQHESVLLGWDTKCPFLWQSESEYEPLLDVSSLPVLPTLPSEMMNAAHQLCAQLEDGDLPLRIKAYPHLVTPFQSDVVVLHPLPQLTHALRAVD